MANIYANVGNKRKRLHKKRIQLPQDWFVTPTWPLLHCFEHQYMAAVTSCEKRSIECFHMTSRRPCWCPKPVLWELNFFLMQTLSFVPINLHRCWTREWKHSIGEKSKSERDNPERYYGIKSHPIMALDGIWYQWLAKVFGMWKNLDLFSEAMNFFSKTMLLSPKRNSRQLLWKVWRKTRLKVFVKKASDSFCPLHPNPDIFETA